jgi:hypothetical protein
VPSFIIGQQHSRLGFGLLWRLNQTLPAQRVRQQPGSGRKRRSGRQSAHCLTVTHLYATAASWGLRQGPPNEPVGRHTLRCSIVLVKIVTCAGTDNRTVTCLLSISSCQAFFRATATHPRLLRRRQDHGLASARQPNDSRSFLPQCAAVGLSSSGSVRRRPSRSARHPENGELAFQRGAAGAL